MGNEMKSNDEMRLNRDTLDEDVSIDKILAAIGAGNTDAIRKMKIEPFVQTIANYLYNLRAKKTMYVKGAFREGTPPNKKAEELERWFDILVEKFIAKGNYEEALLKFMLACDIDPALISIELGRWEWERFEFLNAVARELDMPPILRVNVKSEKKR